MIGYEKQLLYLGAVLHLPFSEGLGSVAYSLSNNLTPPLNPIVTTLQGTTAWNSSGYGVLLDPATPDWVDAPAAATVDLDFTSGAFSMAAWVNCTNLVSVQRILVRGVWNIDGWSFSIQPDGMVRFSTHQPGGIGGQQSFTNSGAIVQNIPVLLGVGRAGSSVRLYINGRDDTIIAAVHTDPITANRKLHIGIQDDETNDPWRGYIYNARIWNRTLTPSEHMLMFNAERHIYGA